MRGKRGQGLSMNIVVIAIIAVLILVVLAIIFTGGVGNATQKMRELFNIGTSEQSLEFVRSQCAIACDSAQLIADESNIKDSSYCKREFRIKEGSESITYKCHGNDPGAKSAGSSCPGVTQFCE